MTISALEEYSFRCALQLARHRGKGPIPASVIADREGISLEYVSKIMHLMRKAGLVAAVRGIQGGFALNREPGQVSLREIARAVAPRSRAALGDFCQSHSGKRESCVHQGACSLQPVWTLVTDTFDQVMGALSLSDLLARDHLTVLSARNLATQHAQALVEAIRPESMS